MSVCRRDPVRVRRRTRVGEIEKWRVSPESLDSVKGSFLADEDVNHEVEVVHEHPLGPLTALDVRRFQPVVPDEPFLDGVGDRQNLAIRRTVADDEVVGDVAQAVEIEDDDLLRLSVSGGVDAVGKLGSQGRVPPSE